MSTYVCRAALAVLLVIAGSTVLGGVPAAAAAPWHLLADVTCEGNTSIWSMDPDGGHKQLYLQGAVDPAISPDDSQIAYATPAGVLVAPVNDLLAAQLVAAGDTDPSWSPDGTRLVVQTPSALAIVTLSSGSIAGVPGTDGASEPAWGSAVDDSGARVSDIAAFNPKVRSDDASSIISVRPDGSQGLAVALPGEYAFEPSWGSDGSFVVADSGGALQLAYPGAYPQQGELPTQPNSESSALRPDAGGPLAYATGTAYGTGDLYLYQDDTPVWDWTDVPAYWAAEFGGTPQTGCGVAHPTWFQGTLGAADTTPPTVNCAAPDASWHAMDVTIACTASDSGSGLASSADASFTLTTAVPAGTETATAATSTRSVCDVAGNCTTAGPVTGIKVDKAPPKVEITSPTSGMSVAQGATLTTAYSCTDGGSGIASCAGPVASGAALDTSTPGPHSDTVTGRDAVGNSASATVTYTVTPTATSLPTISIADASAREGNSAIGNLLLFRITLSKPASGNVRVTATPRPGTATAPSDYFAVPLTLTVRPGQTTVLYPVLIRGDRVVEPDETMTVSLSAVTGAVVGRAVATGTIVNDDR